ncbi:MAG: carboxypeptidase-like regulatory domain-containing protein [Candidatus Limnocylindrales bacterium]
MAASIVLLAAAMVASCQPGSQSVDSPTQAVGTRAIPTAPPSDQMAAWAEFRRTVGLRDDEAWMRYVASHPDAQTEFPAPLMPFEVADLGRDAASTRQAIGIIRSYGVAFPAEWAGAFVQDGRAVAAFAGNVAAHRVALEAMLGGSAILDVREARYSMAELADFASDVAADAHRFEALGARFYDASIDESDNVVGVRYLAPGPEQAAAVVAESILEWYGHPAWLLPRWAGPLPWEGPSGGVVIHVVDPAGAPVTGVYCTVAPLDPRVPNGEAPWTTDVAGRSRIGRLATVDYEIEIRREPGDSTFAGRAVVSIAADATVSVTITLDR